MNTITSPVVAASERHSTSPLPGSGGMCGTTSVRRTTRAPAAVATSIVRSVDPESTTTSSSTSGASPRVSGTIAATIAPTVASSFSAGRTTDTRRPAFAAVRQDGVQAGSWKVRSANHFSVSGCMALLGRRRSGSAALPMANTCSGRYRGSPPDRRIVGRTCVRSA